MKLQKLVVIILISSILYGCATTAPRAIEDHDDGVVLVVEADKVNKVVENWGLQNGFQYVAYRRISTNTSTESSIYANQYSAYGSSKTVYYSNVLVVGINNPKDAPEKFNVVTVPGTLHKEITETGAYLLGFGIGTALFLIVIVSIISHFNGFD